MLNIFTKSSLYKCCDNMITGLSMSKVEGNVSAADMLSKQMPPSININLEDAKSEGNKLKVNYSFTAEYFNSADSSKKSIGSIKLSGIVELQDEKKAVDEAAKKWSDKKSLPAEMTEEIINVLNFRCSATGTLVAYSLGFIPPIIMSAVKVQDQK